MSILKTSISVQYSIDGSTFYSKEDFLIYLLSIGKRFDQGFQPRVIVDVSLDSFIPDIIDHYVGHLENPAFETQAIKIENIQQTDNSLSFSLVFDLAYQCYSEEEAIFLAGAVIGRLRSFIYGYVRCIGSNTKDTNFSD